MANLGRRTDAWIPKKTAFYFALIPNTKKVNILVLVYSELKV